MKIIYAFLIFKITILQVNAQMKFVHPGGVDGKKDLDFVKSKIKDRLEPWKSAFAEVKDLATSGSNALEYINSSNDEADLSKADARKVYANALVWYFTDQEIYAKQAVEILNAWSHLQGFNAGSEQDKLQAAWIGSIFGAAAEIMKCYSGWKISDQLNLRKMFVRAFYPQLNTPSSWNGNVDLTQIEAMMSISVFNEDESEFKMGIDRFNKRILSYFYQTLDGGIPSIDGDGGNIASFWSNPLVWIDGLTQETCRDNNHHAQYAMASAIHAAEIAWHQGVDLYTSNTKRFTDAMELMAKQISTGKMQGVCADNVATTDIFDTWEIGYSHYHFRKKMNLPNTEKFIKERVRIEGVSDWNIFFETLTHADLPHN